MAGIGVKLQKIFDKKSIAAHLVGFVYSTISTVAPMFVVIGNIMLMSYSLGYDTLSYARRGLFSGTILYIFIFSLLTAAPFNAVLSRYMSDVIYEEKYDNILSCYYLGLILNVVFSCLFGITHIGIGKFGQWNTDSDLVEEYTPAARPSGRPAAR